MPELGQSIVCIMKTSDIVTGGLFEEVVILSRVPHLA